MLRKTNYTAFKDRLVILKGPSITTKIYVIHTSKNRECYGAKYQYSKMGSMTECLIVTASY